MQLSGYTMVITDSGNICILFIVHVWVMDSVKAFTSDRSEVLQVEAVLMWLSDIDWRDLQLSEQKRLS